MRESAFYGVDYPYVALCPSNRKKFEFKGITDVHDEIMRLHEQAKQQKGFNVGGAIYEQSFYFVDNVILVTTEMQNRIKEFQFCKTFSCPPYPSLNETPAVIIDDFFIIEEEFNHCVAKQQQEKKDA